MRKTKIDGGAGGAGAGPHAPVTNAGAVPPQAPLPVPVLVDADGTRLVTVGNAAVLTQTSRRTIYNWIAAGRVQVRYTPSGLTRVVVESLFTRVRVEDSQPAGENDQAVAATVAPVGSAAAAPTASAAFKEQQL